MTYRPTWKERMEDAQPFIGPAISLLILLGLGSWLVWHYTAEHRDSSRTVAVPADEDGRRAAANKVAREVDVLERDYRRATEAGEPEKTVGPQLDRVIARQREFLRLMPNVTQEQLERLSRLEAERSSLRSSILTGRSVEAEQEAAAAEKEGRRSVAIERIQAAVQLQHDANAAAQSPALQNLQREKQLQEQLAQYNSLPIRTALETALALAHSAAAQSRWEDALKAYTEARGLRVQLNNEYPSTPAVDLNALNDLDGEIASLKARRIASISGERERDGDVALAAGRIPEAAAAYGDAISAQQEVNDKYSKSKYLSTRRVEELEVKRQSALSTLPMGRVHGMDREITDALRGRRSAEAVARLAPALALLEKTAVDYPQSRELDAPLHLKLSYLTLRTADFDALQAMAYDALAPLPGSTTVRMLRTEVSQDLYLRVMNTNPSRNAGRTFPVDSVNWNEAQDFCQRLGWILGRPVRLPTEAEFRLVLVATGGTAWSADSSGGRSHEVGKSAANSAGFTDLAGNVAEWLQSSDEAAPKAPVGGGSYRDASDDLKKDPVREMAKTERSPQVGFRIVIEGS